MTRYFTILIFLFLLSCGNEVIVNMDNDGIPVAYCILDVDDSIQQVRLAKSFFPEKGYTGLDHLTLKQWDEPVEIYIEERINSEVPTVYEFYSVEKIRQDTGYFTNPSFQLYESKLTPAPNALYNIYLWFPARNDYAFASTVTVDHPEIINPTAVPGRKVTFSDMDDFIVQFIPPLNSEFHQFGFVLTVEEHLATGFNLDYFNYGAQVYEENSDQVFAYLLNSARFFSGLLSRYDSIIGEDYRRIAGLEFVVYSYGKELRLYNQLYDNGTQSWQIQTYSSFRNGFGLFSSKAHSRATNLELSKLTLQILTRDPRYKHLKFSQ